MGRGQGPTPDTDVLVVGAGPAGLTTALQAQAHGASVRVVDRRPHLTRPSRALMLHARALEGLRPLAVTGELLRRADTTPEARLHLGRRIVEARLGHADLPDTAFPHLTLVRQADVEAVLWQALQERGVHVDWGVEFRGLGRGGAQPEGGMVRAQLCRDGGGREEHDARFLAGCDGQAGTVRSITGARWEGGPYRVEAVLADLELDGPLDPGVLHVAVGSAGLTFLSPLGKEPPGACWQPGPRTRNPPHCSASWARPSRQGKWNASSGSRGSAPRSGTYGGRRRSRFNTVLPVRSASIPSSWQGTPRTHILRPAVKA